MDISDELQFKYIVKTMEAPDIFFDLGPGTLNSEAWYAKEAWPNCRIIGVEAGKDRYDKLKNTYPGELLNCAVCDIFGQEQGYEGGRYGMFMFGYLNPINKKWDTQKKVTVLTTTIDHLFQSGGFPKNSKVFIWADIEGAELRMLKGATSLLKNRNIIGLNLELFPKNPYKVWPEKNYNLERCNAQEVSVFLNEWGFENLGATQFPDFHKINPPDWESKNWFADYFFKLKDKL